MKANKQLLARAIDTLEWLIQEREAGTEKGLLPDGLLNKARLILNEYDMEIVK